MKPSQNSIPGRALFLYAGALLLLVGRIDAQSVSVSDEPPLILTPFTVTGTEVLSYGGGSAGGSGRLQKPYTEIAQSVTVLTSEFLNDAMIFNIRDSLKFVPNVNGGANHTPTYNIRGLVSNSVMVDGFLSGKHLNFDNFFADRVEVVKGPSGLAFGRGDPAGFINFVSKRPLGKRKTAVETMIGTGNSEQMNVRVGVDHSDVLPGDSKTAYRLAALYHRGADTQDLSEYERKGVLLSAATNIGKKGKLSLIANVQRNENPSAVGNQSFVNPYIRDEWLFRAGNATADVPVRDRDFVFGYHGDHFDETINIFTAIYEQVLGDRWSVRLAVNHVANEKIGVYGAGNIGSIVRDGTGTLTVAVPQLKDFNAQKGASYQADVYGELPIEALRGKFTLLFGGDLADTEDATARLVAGTPRQPYLNFNRTTPSVTFADIRKAGLKNDGRSYGAYVEAGAAVLDERLLVSAAVRRQYFKLDNINLTTGTVAKIDRQTELVPQYSVIWKVRPTHSLYFLKSEHEDPSTFVAKFFGIPTTDPRINEKLQVQPTTKLQEIGLKGSLGKAKLSYSIAYFNGESVGAQKQLIVQESINGVGTPVEHRYLSNDSVDGWEITVFGDITPKLMIMLGAGFMDSKGQEGTGAATKFIPLLETQDSISAYVRYAFGKNLGADGLSLLAGFKTILSGWNMSQVRDNPYPKDESAFDVGASYQWGNGRYQVSGKINNLFNGNLVQNQTWSTPSRMAFLEFKARF